MALSYMGSKRRIAKDLYNVIASREGGTWKPAIEKLYIYGDNK